jgi:hypothetical protein
MDKVFSQCLVLDTGIQRIQIVAWKNIETINTKKLTRKSEHFIEKS